MKPLDPEHELRLLIQSRHGLIILRSTEPDRVPHLLREVAKSLKLAFYQWSASKGLLPDRENSSAVMGSQNPVTAFKTIEDYTVQGIYYFEPFDEWFTDKIALSHLRDAVKKFQTTAGAVIILCENPKIPDMLKPYVAVYQLPVLSEPEYRTFITDLVEELCRSHQGVNRLTAPELEKLISNLRGMTFPEIRKTLTRAMIDDRRFTTEDLQHILHAKKSIIEQSGHLEFFASKETISDVAGLKGLKTWLDKRRNFFKDPVKAQKMGLEFPKGILLLGVQGCGKSLCAKTVANDWGLPLLRLDASKIYDKYVGESEKNFSNALRLAEKVSPVVLWIDEIEKAFSADGNESDSGTSQRILGMFLTWLQERKGNVFIVATANNIQLLPPEFLRKGRFDEIFFVDLPDADSRRKIFEIHLKKRNQDPGVFDLQRLSESTPGYSGAEIEQAVLSALYSCLSDGSNLKTESLLHEIKTTKPLSLIMADKINALRKWAHERTVSAD